MTHIDVIIWTILAASAIAFVALLILAAYETQRPIKPHRRYGKGLSSKADPL